jgi:hypothetical protein
LRSTRFFGALLGLIVTFALTGCEQLAALQNNKARIAGDWYKIDRGFRSDELFAFDEGIIERDGINWGSYKFIHNDLIEVSFDTGQQGQEFNLEFPTEDSMIWFQIKDEKRVVLHEWERSFG